MHGWLLIAMKVGDNVIRYAQKEEEVVVNSLPFC